MVTVLAGRDRRRPRAARCSKAAGVPALISPERGVRGRSAYLVALRAQPRAAPADAAAARRRVRHRHRGRAPDHRARAAGGGARCSTSSDSKALLASFGINIARTALARSADEAVALAQEIGFPVVLKVGRAGRHAQERRRRRAAVAAHRRRRARTASTPIAARVAERAPAAKFIGVLRAADDPRARTAAN
ncbi:MAG: acetate--CoA ligase family protein [Comamonadaceae bacterium]|nr:acetate--CoA ligase family protein [Comamonadaceae bacterium]